ncbi:transcriptional regulator [Sphingomonas sp. Leaf10]|uniref:transcriptional regulator n=1 Tax=Sphingomonas sp. Leaf10 TaxID=1735676 RepID=UPI0006FB98A6|nr:transcriptional regulator [Sphingomonas sp. Leaf10]KQM37963.1 hypothetical protein ASE59_11735 [Sphingomonas sp. Leaf10]
MADHSQDDAAVHFALSISTVQRMCKAIGFKRPIGAKTKSSPHRPQHPAPDWFRREASTMTRAEACQRAGVSQSTIDRWMREAGVRCNVLRGFSYRRQNAVPVRMADMSLAGRAADFLRPRWPNHRCDEDGQQNFNGRYWRFGTAILTADEVIERAKRRGFDSDAWMRIAA